MKGVVNARGEATIRLKLCGSGKQGHLFTAVIDTGYNGFLTMPNAMIQSLGLRSIGKTWATLADGHVVSFDVYAGILQWNGRRRQIEIHAAQSDPLIGMELLEGCELNIRVKAGGVVTISWMK